MPKDCLTLYLGSELKPAWLAYCQQRGLSPGAALRGSIEQELARIKLANPQSKASPARRRQVIDEPDDGDKIRRELRLTPSEDRAVVERADQEECSPQRWMIYAIRAALTHEPQFTMSDTRALWESSSQLRAIGRNLNQIAKRLNERDDAMFPVEQLDELRAAISQHTAQVSQVIAGSTNRWVIE